MAQLDRLNVGKLVNTHGIRGEVKIVPTTDFPEERFAKGSRLIMTEPDTARVTEVEVESARLHKNMFIVKLKGYDNINEVEKYKGWTLQVAKENLNPLDDGEYYYYEIIGCKVVTEDGEELGAISEILSPGANDVWVVKRPKEKDLLLPVIDDVVLKVDAANKLITVRLMEGLI